ncbi:MAG: leucine-rich repeat domain-containing protein [Clostridia bacterium]|nr:leucine-rich repeat domain-containing protein [Clostridia bacterium]
MKKTISFALIFAVFISFSLTGFVLAGDGVESETGVEDVGGENYDAYAAEETITVANTVTKLADFAFSKCALLKTVYIAKSVTAIGVGAFNQCKALTDVYYEASETAWSSVTIGDLNSPLNAATKHFNENIGIGHETGVEDIGGENYDAYADKETITVADTVTRLDDFAFSKCTLLKTVYIPKSVTAIGVGAFKQGKALTDVYYEGSETEWSSVTIGDLNGPLNAAAKHFNENIGVGHEIGVEDADPILGASVGLNTQGKLKVTVNALTAGKVVTAFCDKTTGQFVSANVQTMLKGTNEFIIESAPAAYTAKVMFLNENNVPLSFARTFTK